MECAQTKASSKGRNRNLIILRAGDGSLHGSWLNPASGVQIITAESVTQLGGYHEQARLRQLQSVEVLA